MIYSVFGISALIGVAAAFLPSQMRLQRPGLSLQMSEAPVEGKPLVDRALDSALDFLQDGLQEGEPEEDDFAMFDIFDDSPEFDIPHDLIAQYAKEEADREATRGVSVAETSKKELNEKIARWQRNPGDVGSPEVQVCISDHRIRHLTQHLMKNKKDQSTKRGLIALVNLRKNQLNYLHRVNPVKCSEMIKELGIRFRPSDQSWDKQSKYGAYKNTRSKWDKIRADKRAYKRSREAANQ